MGSSLFSVGEHQPEESAPRELRVLEHPRPARVRITQFAFSITSTVESASAVLIVIIIPR